MIDAHIHIFPQYRSVKAVRWLKRYIPWLTVGETVSESQIVTRLRECGISYFFNYVYPLDPEESEPLNRFNHQLSQRIKNAVCFGSVHPANTHKEEIVRRAILDLDLIGLKFHPFVQKFHILEKRMNEVYRTMELLNRPIAFHTGFDRFYGDQMTPEEMQELLRRYPGLTVVLCHMFYPRFDEAFKLLETNENVYLDLTNVFSDYREPVGTGNRFEGFLVEKEAERTYEVFFNYPLERLEARSDRVMMGSDYPVAMNSLEKIYACIPNTDLSETAKHNISEGTARALVEKFKPGFFDQRLD